MGYSRVEHFLSLVAIVPFGAGLGAILANYILAHVNRRNSLIFTDLIGIVGMIFSIIPDVWLLLASRFVIGLATGLNSAIVHFNER
jgi:predicted MFS family arabinose efflux permease